MEADRIMENFEILDKNEYSIIDYLRNKVHVIIKNSQSKTFKAKCGIIGIDELNLIVGINRSQISLIDEYKKHKLCKKCFKGVYY